MSPDVTIMIVDDELFYRQVLRDMIGEAGFTVVAEATDGEDALAKYHACHPTLTIIDVFMPKKNGIEAIREIIAADSTATVLVSTTTGFDDEIQAALQAGARGVVWKPFLAAEVAAAIRQVLAE